MIDPVSSWALGVFAGGAVGFWIGRSWPHPARRMRPPGGSYGPPHPTGGRVVDMYGRTIGYQPRPHGETPNPPPEMP